MGYSIIFLVVVGLFGNCLLTKLIHGTRTFTGPQALPWQRNVCGWPFECLGLALIVVLLFGNIYGQRNITHTTTARITPTTLAPITPTTTPITTTTTTTTTTPATACRENYSLYAESCGKFCYRYESNVCRDWSDARKACEAEGGDLLEPSECNYEFFRERAEQNEGFCEPYFWLGAQRSPDRDNFRTVKGKTISKTANFWGSGRPNNLNEADDCLEMSKDIMYKANDEACFRKEGYICQIIM